MSSPYDHYDYPSYWLGRHYEQRSEELAITTLLKNVGQADNILEIGAGFGRLTHLYKKLGSKIMLTDPSKKLLDIAQNTHNDKNISYKCYKLEELPEKIKENSQDLIILIRVMHHVNNCRTAIIIIHSLLRSGGYFLMEYPNKQHIKNILKNILKKKRILINDKMPLDISKGDKKSLPFKNYHPEMIEKLLMEEGFEIIEKLSVSNIRINLFKKIIGNKILIFLEKLLQKPLSRINFGPSIFILARKI